MALLEDQQPPELPSTARCIAVGLAADEQQELAGTASVRPEDALPEALGTGDVDVVVVGSAAHRPVELVQRTHQLVPGATVVVLTDAEGDRVRRELSYSPGVPLDLHVHSGEHEAGSRQALVLDCLARAALRRQHDTVLSALSAGPARGAHHAPAPVDLGPLLEHAPVGVLVVGPDGRLHAWNHRAAALLELGTDDASVDALVSDVLPGSGPVLRSVTSLLDPRSTAGGSPPAEEVLTAPSGREVEVTGVLSEGAEGRPVAMLLLLDVTERRRAERESERLAGAVNLLGLVSQALERTLEVREALERLTSVMVPDFADWVSIQLADDSERPGDLSVVTVRHHDPALTEVVEAARRRQSLFASERSPGRRAARDGRPVLLTNLDEAAIADYVHDPELQQHFVDLGVDSVLAVPLPGREHVLGSMVLVRGPSSVSFTDADVTVAVEAGRRAGVALDNARLYSNQRDLATELQRSLLTDPPQPDHCQIVVRYVAAAHEAQVGGDWYDAFLQADGSTVLVVGDVVGHDRRAAAGMSQVRGVLRGIGYTTGEDPASLLQRADQALEGLEIPAVATAVVARLERTTAAARADEVCVSWANAGHPPPLLMLPDGHVTVLQPDDPGPVEDHLDLVDVRGLPSPDLLLGFDPSTRRTCWRRCVPRGSTLLLYTDGLVERRGELLDTGLTRLVDVLTSIGPHATLDELCDLTLQQLVPGDQEDDVALVAVRLHPEDQPRPPEAGPEVVPEPRFRAHV